MNYFDTLIEVADDCPTKKAQWYKQLLDDPHTTKVKAFRSSRA